MVSRYLHGEHALWSQSLDQPGEQGLVIVDPMEGGVGEDEIHRM